MTELATIATHPTVRLNLFHDTEQWHFARWYVVTQERCAELLSLGEMIEQYRCRPIGVNE